VAEALDVCNAIADAAVIVTDALVGVEYEIPSTIDAQTYGSTRVVPSIRVGVIRPTQQELQECLATGKINVTVEADVHDGAVHQYTNDGAQLDLVDSVPITLAATPAPAPGGSFTWDLSGTATPGNVIGIQAGTVGAAYTVLPGDTLNTIGSNLAIAAVAAGIPTIADDGSFTVTAPEASVAIGTTRTYVRAIARRARNFDVWVWAANPFDRQFLVRSLEPLYAPGSKFPMNDGSQVIVADFLGTIQEDGSGNGELRDGLYVARTRWLMKFTTTEFVTAPDIVAATISLDTVPYAPTPLLASQL